MSSPKARGYPSRGYPGGLEGVTRSQGSWPGHTPTLLRGEEGEGEGEGADKGGRGGSGIGGAPEEKAEGDGQAGRWHRRDSCSRSF